LVEDLTEKKLDWYKQVGEAAHRSRGRMMPKSCFVIEWDNMRSGETTIYWMPNSNKEQNKEEKKKEKKTEKKTKQTTITNKQRSIVIN